MMNSWGTMSYEHQLKTFSVIEYKIIIVIRGESEVLYEKVIS